MKPNENFTISSGNIIALWQLILLTDKHEAITVKSAVEITLNSGLAGGGLPANQALKLGQYCKILEINNQELLSSQFCRKEILPLCQTEEPNVYVIRAVIYRFMILQNFDWLLFFNNDPEIFKIGIPENWIELLESANLFDFKELAVTEWWSKIFSRFRTYKEGQKLEIGKVAESLTYLHEKTRLLNDGLDNNDFYVKWASQITDTFGFDVLSIRGTLLKETFNIKDEIQIEVKCSVNSNEKEFRFYVSKNEWNKASNNITSYFFYCWTSANLERQSANGPYIIPALKLKDHIPEDRGQLCEWSECKFVIDLHLI